MLYKITDGTVSIGGKTILSHIDFYVKEKEKLAIVGRNGAGKTTLLRLLAGEILLDRDDKSSGGVLATRSITIGMLSQTNIQQQDMTIEQILLSACPDKDTYSKTRYDYEMEYDRLFTSFGFDKSQKNKKLSEFSGGEQTKISLIRLLLEKPDLLLLDEPTNHLDIKTTEWLEDYLKNYEHAVVMVSHDRAFLDAVSDSVYEIDHQRLTRYAGNYSTYRAQKLKNIEAQKRAYARQQEEITHTKELIEKFKHKPRKASFARSRQTMLNRMEHIEKPHDDEAYIFTGDIEPKFPGPKCVYEAKGLQIGYDKKALLELSLRIKRGSKIAVIGENGVGKTTFLRTCAGLIEPIKGGSILATNALVGYFDQQTALIEGDETVRDHFGKLFPDMNEKDLRATLGAYLFGKSLAQQKISSLSGGEKARLVLAEMLTSRPNFLILDEPTNHMDISAKETLESAFRAYKGTMLFVSHDRYFVKQVADSLLVFEDGKALYYPFGYDHYIERIKQRDGDLPAMVSAKDQAMIEALAAVPKPERHETRRPSTDEAYIDWKLRLASQPLEEIENEVELFFTELLDVRKKLDEAILRDYESVMNGSNNELESDDYETASRKFDEACELWTKECLKWYDVYESL